MAAAGRAVPCRARRGCARGRRQARAASAPAALLRLQEAGGDTAAVGRHADVCTSHFASRECGGLRARERSRARRACRRRFRRPKRAGLRRASRRSSSSSSASPVAAACRTARVSAHARTAAPPQGCPHIVAFDAPGGLEVLSASSAPAPRAAISTFTCTLRRSGRPCSSPYAPWPWARLHYRGRDQVREGWHVVRAQAAQQPRCAVQEAPEDGCVLSGCKAAGAELLWRLLAQTPHRLSG